MPPKASLNIGAALVASFSDDALEALLRSNTDRVSFIGMPSTQPPIESKLSERLRSFYQRWSGYIRTAEFSLAVGAAFVALAAGGDMFVVIPSLVLAFVFAFLGLLASNVSSKTIWIGAVLILILLSLEGATLHLHFEKPSEHTDAIAHPPSPEPIGCSGEFETNEDIKEREKIFASKTSDVGKLGSPQGCIHIVRRASKAEFEHAIEIWTVFPQKGFYIMPKFGNTWDFYAENVECTYDWCRGGDKEGASRIHFEQRLRKKIPPGLHPFYGATALWVDSDLSRFNFVGWQIWSCEMTMLSPPTFYREFAHGKALGIYNAGKDDNSGQIQLLYNDKTTDIIDLGPEHIAGNPCSK